MKWIRKIKKWISKSRQRGVTKQMLASRILSSSFWVLCGNADADTSENWHITYFWCWVYLGQYRFYWTIKRCQNYTVVLQGPGYPQQWCGNIVALRNITFRFGEEVTDLSKPWSSSLVSKRIHSKSLRSVLLCTYKNMVQWLLTFCANVIALNYKWKKNPPNALRDVMGPIKCFYLNIYLLMSSS